MPRLIEGDTCPHCGEKLPEPKPRACPECGGSQQQRHLKTGCFSAGPALFLLAVGLTWFLS